MVETNIVRIPLRNINIRLFDLKIINIVNNWVIKNNALLLTEDVMVFGMNESGERVFTNTFAINISLGNMRWESEMPDLISHTNIWGNCYASILKKNPKSQHVSIDPIIETSL